MWECAWWEGGETSSSICLTSLWSVTAVLFFYVMPFIVLSIFLLPASEDWPHIFAAHFFDMTNLPDGGRNGGLAVRIISLNTGGLNVMIK